MELASALSLDCVVVKSTYALFVVIALNQVLVLVVLPTIGSVLSVESQHIEKGT